jgi:hypothetical protein
LKERERKKTTSVTRQSIVRTEGRKPKSNDRFPFNSLTRRKSRGKKSKEIKKNAPIPLFCAVVASFDVLVLLLLASALSANVTALRLNMMKMVCFYLKKFDTSRSLLFLCFLRFTTEKSFEKKNERVHFYARA